MKFYLLLVLSVALVGLARCDPITQLPEVDSAESAESQEQSVLEEAKEKLEIVHKDLEEHGAKAAATIKKAVSDVKANVSANILSSQTKVNVKCESDSQCGQNGVCSSNHTCQCSEGFVTRGDSVCGYEQKSKVTAFLLSLFLGNFGADWFYLARENSNYNWAGFFKLLLGLCVVIASCFKCCAQICFKAMDDNKMSAAIRVVVGGIISLASLANLLWYFIDWIRILFDAFPDGNHMPLKAW